MSQNESHINNINNFILIYITLGSPTLIANFWSLVLLTSISLIFSLSASKIPKIPKKTKTLTTKKPYLLPFISVENFQEGYSNSYFVIGHIKFIV